MVEPDIVVVGSGIGGATLAASLAPSGMQIVILERGEELHDSPDCRDDKAIFKYGAFRPQETWYTSAEEEFNPGNYYYVGGNSKFYGGVMMRYRAEDFDELQHLGGVSPAWPITYQELEPWYQAAETMYQVCGDAGQDPTEPWHSGQYVAPPIADEPAIKRLRYSLGQNGVTPACLPLAVDLDRWLEGGMTPWDAFPDTNGGKKDAQSIGIALALSYPNVKLVTNAKVSRLIVGDYGRIEAVEYEHNNNLQRLNSKIIVLSAGAVNSAVILLRSADRKYPRGLANSSNLVGRNFMNHNSSALLAINPWRVNNAVYQKTLQVNDYYLRGGSMDMPLGNIQLLGKISGTILASQSSLPLVIANWIASHSVDWYVMSEDLPNLDSRVILQNDKIVLDWKRSNWDAHMELVRKAKQMLKRAGFPLVFTRPFDRRTPSHQCGTTCFGHDPATSVLDVFCRSHDHRNLFVMDAGFLPTSAAVNPSLTIAAQALRVAEHIQQEGLQSSNL